MEPTLTNTADYYAFVMPPPEAEVGAAIAELNSLLLLRGKLSCDIARLRKLLKNLTQDAGSQRQEERSHEKSLSISHFSRLSAADHRLPPLVKDEHRPQREQRNSCSKLERACRIALMENTEPAAAEAIYDRIQRRESHSFAGYKRPLRAIRLVMSAMVKRGEARLLNEAGHRRWHWLPRAT
jgi:hypothetical protein